jgi:hypothetical protein
MNFLQAQNVHVLWKVRLEKYLQDHHEKPKDFDIDTAGDKEKCELGVWLNEKRELLSQSEHFPALEDLHSEFHDIIQQFIDNVDNDHEAEAKEILKGKYKEISHQLKITLSKLARDFDYKI